MTKQSKRREIPWHFIVTFSKVLNLACIHYLLICKNICSRIAILVNTVKCWIVIWSNQLHRLTQISCEDSYLRNTACSRKWDHNPWKAKPVSLIRDYTSWKIVTCRRTLMNYGDPHLNTSSQCSANVQRSYFHLIRCIILLWCSNM